MNVARNAAAILPTIAREIRNRKLLIGLSLLSSEFPD